jgi:predicted SprT family Zn-dependent metalloprotease
MKIGLLDQPPDVPHVTDYDLAHKVVYLRLLDAAAEGADWREVARIVLGLDPATDPDRAQRIHDSHLKRARWMTEAGYRDLLRRAAMN